MGAHDMGAYARDCLENMGTASDLAPGILLCSNRVRLGRHTMDSVASDGSRKTRKSKVRRENANSPVAGSRMTMSWMYQCTCTCNKYRKAGSPRLLVPNVD